MSRAEHLEKIAELSASLRRRMAAFEDSGNPHARDQVV